MELTKRSCDWFGSGRHVWKIEHPQGFEFEVSSENMFALLETVDVSKGEIMDECVFAFSGAYMSLIPVNSDLYKQTFKNEKRLDSKVNESDLTLGQEITLKNGKTGIYYGKFNCLVKESIYQQGLKIHVVKRSFVFIKDKLLGDKFEGFGKLEISYANEIPKKLAKQECLNTLNEAISINRKNSSFYISIHGKTLFGVYDKVPDLSSVISCEKVDHLGNFINESKVENFYRNFKLTFTKPDFDKTLNIQRIIRDNEKETHIEIKEIELSVTKKTIETFKDFPRSIKKSNIVKCRECFIIYLNTPSGKIYL